MADATLRKTREEGEGSVRGLSFTLQQGREGRYRKSESIWLTRLRSRARLAEHLPREVGPEGEVDGLRPDDQACQQRGEFGVVSRRLARQFVSLLKDFGIPSNTYPVKYEGKKTLYHVHVTGRINIQKFKIRVGLTDPTKEIELNLALRR